MLLRRIPHKKSRTRGARLFILYIELFILRFVEAAFGHGYFRLAFITVLIEFVATAQYKCQNTGNFHVKQETGGRHPVTGKIILIFNCMLHMYFFRNANLQSKSAKSKYSDADFGQVAALWLCAVQEQYGGGLWHGSDAGLFPLPEMRQHVEGALVEEVIPPDHDAAENTFEVI